MRSHEVRSAEIRFIEVRLAEVRPAEVRPVETRPVETRPAQVGPAEVRPAEDRLLEVSLDVGILLAPFVPGSHPLPKLSEVLVLWPQRRPQLVLCRVSKVSRFNTTETKLAA